MRERKVGVVRVLELRELNNSSLNYSPNEISKFFIPQIKFTVKKLHELVDYKDGITEPLTINFSDDQIRETVLTLKNFQYPIHSQAVE